MICGLLKKSQFESQIINKYKNYLLYKIKSIYNKIIIKKCIDNYNIFEIYCLQILNDALIHPGLIVTSTYIQ